MEKMEIYDSLKSVPKEFTKKIGAGRLKGMTDIKPQWKIQKLTEQFGPCGIGWKYTIDKQWHENFEGQVVCFVNISLYIKNDNEWSAAIPGHGGNKLVAREKAGLYVSDEGYKMAITDAIGNAAKYLGVAADVFMGYEPTKYQAQQNDIQIPISEIEQKINEAKAMTHLNNVWKKYGPTIKDLPKAECQRRNEYLPSSY